MKENNDEEIQRLIEDELKKYSLADKSINEDEQLYKWVFEALAQEPVTPSGNTMLADNVVVHIKAEEEKKASTKYNLTIAAVITGSLLLTFVCLSIISPAVLNSIGSKLTLYKWTVLFIVFSLTAIQLLDQFVVRQKITYHD